MEFFDSHAHYDDEKFEGDRENIIKAIVEEDITKLVSAGYNIKSSEYGIILSQKYKEIYTTVGISPNDLNDTEKNENWIEYLEKLANNKKVVAIGEIGLDYYWNKENKELQKDVFIKQIELANKMKLPIVIHSREAVQDTLEILKTHPALKGGIFHCCPLNREFIKEGLKLGFYISFAGPITFKNSKNSEEIIKMVPLDKMLIETDSPYLSPEPKRGTRNDSRNIKYIAQKIAKTLNVSIEEIAKNTYNNAKKIYDLK